MDALTQGAVFLAIAGLWSVFVAKVLGPWAWARAVDNPKSKASRVLTRVLKETREAIVAGVKLPTAEDLAKAMPKPDLSGLQLQVDLASQFESPAFVTALDNAIKRAEDRRRMSGVREAKGEMSAAEAQDAAIVGNAVANPEGAQMYQAAKRYLEIAADNGLIKEGRALKWTKQLDKQFAETGDIGDLLKLFNIRPEMLVNVGGGATPGRTGTGSHY